MTNSVAHRQQHIRPYVNPLRTNFKILYGGIGQIRPIPTCLALRGLKELILYHRTKRKWLEMLFSSVQ